MDIACAPEINESFGSPANRCALELAQIYIIHSDFASGASTEEDSRKEWHQARFMANSLMEDKVGRNCEYTQWMSLRTREYRRRSRQTLEDFLVWCAGWLVLLRQYCLQPLHHKFFSPIRPVFLPLVVVLPIKHSNPSQHLPHNP